MIPATWSRAALATLLLAAACGPQPTVPPPQAGAVAAPVPPAGAHTVTVWATQSLRRPFELLARRYEQKASGSKIDLFFAGGAELLNERNAGRSCDVVAIGDSSLMSRFASAAHLAVGSPTELARGRIAIAVPAGNPAAIQGLADLQRPGLKLAFGKRTSSIGRYTRWALSRADLELAPAVEVDTADAVLAAVRGGRADAGIVYATTFVGQDGVVRIDVQEADNQPVLYSISVDREAREPRGAASFRALALSPEGQQILRDCGFLPIGAK
jgi:molybdate transport system substrate-binding protein